MTNLPSPPQSDLDILMSHVHEINSKSAAEVTDRDIDILIAYHRHNRARKVAGYRPTRPERPKVDVLGLLNIKPQAQLPAPAGTKLRRI